jgi:hypothetical protein
MKITTIVFALLFTTSTGVLNLGSQAGAEVPEPECVTANYGGSNESACGYNCEISGDGNQAECAEWPEGKCEAGYNSVACGPPAPDNWQDNYQNSELDRDCDCDCDKRQ